MIGAVVWVGVLITGVSLLVWAERAGERTFAAKLHAAIAWLEPPVGAAGPLLLLVTGIWLVIDGPWGFSDLWILVGLVGYGVALALGAGFEGPVGRRYGSITRERGADDPEAVALLPRLQAVGYLELAVLLVVLLAMTTKPEGGGSVGFWVASALVVGGAVTLALWAGRRDGRFAPRR